MYDDVRFDFLKPLVTSFGVFWIVLVRLFLEHKTEDPLGNLELLVYSPALWESETASWNRWRSAFPSVSLGFEVRSHGKTDMFEM